VECHCHQWDVWHNDRLNVVHIANGFSFDRVQSNETILNGYTSSSSQLTRMTIESTLLTFEPCVRDAYHVTHKNAMHCERVQKAFTCRTIFIRINLRVSSAEDFALTRFTVLQFVDSRLAYRVCCHLHRLQKWVHLGAVGRLSGCVWKPVERRFARNNIVSQVKIS
jgi:hypothetical protein